MSHHVPSLRYALARALLSQAVASDNARRLGAKIAHLTGSTEGDVMSVGRIDAQNMLARITAIEAVTTEKIRRDQDHG